MQIQKINSFNSYNNKKTNNPSFEMIKITSAVKGPDLIIDMFEQKGKHVIGIVDNKVCHILKTSEFVEEQHWLNILKKYGFKAESISQEEGTKIIQNIKTFDNFLDDTIKNDEPFLSKLKDIMKNNPYD